MKPVRATNCEGTDNPRSSGGLKDGERGSGQLIRRLRDLEKGQRSSHDPEDEPDCNPPEGSYLPFDLIDGILKSMLRNGATVPGLAYTVASVAAHLDPPGDPSYSIIGLMLAALYNVGLRRIPGKSINGNWSSGPSQAKAAGTLAAQAGCSSAVQFWGWVAWVLRVGPRSG
ncbi:hypothetical protein B0H14DRAFT_2572407 [Mycena olivaceomarginata]|nr:hypothetical protein B0H14DRAFT_2572407 [Mycena olivaceomarginata]